MIFALIIEFHFFPHFRSAICYSKSSRTCLLLIGPLCSYTFKRGSSRPTSVHMRKGLTAQGSSSPEHPMGLRHPPWALPRQVQIHASRKCLPLSLPRVSMTALSVGTGEGHSILPQVLIVLHFFQPFWPTLFTMTKKPSKLWFLSSKEHL